MTLNIKPVTFSVFLLSLTLVVTTMAGCETKSKLGGKAVGQVYLDGSPLEQGEIVFVDLATKEPNGGQIRNGKFSVDILPGEKTVQITANKVTGTSRRNPSDPNSETVDVTSQYLPAEYNAKTTLKATITEKSEPLRFDLKSTP
ncbi:MAG: hypothetical protein FWD31_08725 [Planctomycetaceae bacterium]|nr:hypothetical protein [Planctomycetaceae bacterium]